MHQFLMLAFNELSLQVFKGGYLPCCSFYSNQEGWFTVATGEPSLLYDPLTEEEMITSLSLCGPISN